MAGDFGVAAVDENFGAGFFAFTDQSFDAEFALRGDDGADLDAVFKTVADPEFRGGVGDGVAESLLRLADCNGDGNGEAALSGASEGAVADDVGSHGHVGVGKNDDGIFRSTLALRAFAAGCGAGVNVLGDWGGADEADGANFGMIEERVHGGLAAVDEIDDTFGQANLLDEFERALHGERNALAGL